MRKLRKKTTAPDGVVAENVSAVTGAEATTTESQSTTTTSNKASVRARKVNGISLYDPNFIAKEDADRLFAELLKLPWKQHTMKMYGKEIPMPRRYQWMGLTPTIYGEKVQPMEWTPEGLEIRQRIEVALGFLYDSCNINFYRDGKDHIGWHSDDRCEGLWQYPIASISFGASRDFQTCPYLGNGKWKRRFHKHFGTPDSPVTLEHGSLVVMPAGSQEFYVHRLKKATKEQGDGARINLTFRMMDDPRS